MKKIIILVSILLVVVFLPAPIQAQQLDTCDEKVYCERNPNGSEKGLIRKNNCQIAQQFVNECIDFENQTGQSCKQTNRRVCICNYETLITNSCVNPGGTSDVKNSIDSVFGRINPPDQIRSVGFGSGAIANIIQRGIQLLYAIAGIAVLLIILWSAFQLITSGGDKEAIAGARKRITWAIIGLVLLALAFPLIRVLGTVIGIPIL